MGKRGKTTAAVLSEEEHQDVLHRLILPAATRNAVPQENPVVVVVSGPSGAGKSEVGDLVQAALDRRGGAVRVGRDLYKPVHRHYPALLKADVRTAGVRVRPDTIRWQAEVEEYVRRHRFDAVVESALASEDEFRALSAAYRSSRHRIEVVAVATARALAQLGVLDRFLTGEFRYVSWENQDTCTAGMLRTLAVIEAEQLADRVAVVRRGMEPLYDNEITHEGTWARPVAAATTARTEQLRPWSAPQSRVFRRELTRAEVLVHDERLPADARLAVSRDAERAAAAAEPVRRIAHPLPGPPEPATTASARRSTGGPSTSSSPRSTCGARRSVRIRSSSTWSGSTGPGSSWQAGWCGGRCAPAVRIEPDRLRGAHPDHFQLVTDRAKAHRDLGDTAASRDGMQQVAAAGGRYASDAARGLAHLARAAGDFPTALAAAQTLGWPGRGNRVLGDIHFARGDMAAAAAAYTAARAEAEEHGNMGERAIAQAHLALTAAFAAPARAEGEIAYARQLLAGLDQRATTLTAQVAELVRTARHAEDEFTSRADRLRAEIVASGITATAPLLELAVVFHHTVRRAESSVRDAAGLPLPTPTTVQWAIDENTVRARWRALAAAAQ
ncbi:zeta toxin family protein [Streptomyces tanashiensis]|uniref:zeta toxin family protein n=1 Tax=Streptomyces tanashiensis TaxID=67367 RepID=UPI0036EF8E46